MDEAYLFNRGENYEAYKYLGSFPLEEGGFVFRVYAPQAVSVRVTGDFNNWDTEGRFMRRLGNSGIFEGAVAEAKHWQRYKYLVESRDGKILEKADPFARHAELRPGTASILYAPDEPFVFDDEAFLRERDLLDGAELAPLNIYECHLGSWRRYPDGHFYNYRELAHQLADYLIEMGYNALEILPITEYPLDASWGYQVTSYFAPSSRYGTPEDFKYFVNYLHKKGLRLILDWVPAHFPKDAFGLARFDGTPCYEYADPRLGEHAEWGTLVFDYSKYEVQSFLLSSAWFWFEEYHIDGMRVDAVSAMLYLSFARTEFLKNRYGGIENLEAIEFLRRLNTLIRSKKKGALMIAEEATTFPKITAPVEEGGLGFTHKWNMGWMHDILDYMKYDYYARNSQHHKMTFSLTYAFSENYVLPFSHDEVVHGKKSLIGRMPGDIWRQCASLRTLFAWQAAHPGAKLNFMGNEFGQFIEWRFYEELEWFMLRYPHHRQIKDFVAKLNHLYLEYPSFWRNDRNWEGFRWLEADDAAHSVYLFERRGREEDAPLLFVFNMTPAVLRQYPLRTGRCGRYRLLLNSDEEQYGGSSYGTLREGQTVQTEPSTLSDSERLIAGEEERREEKREELVQKRAVFLKLRDELLSSYRRFLEENGSAESRDGEGSQAWRVLDFTMEEIPPCLPPQLPTPHMELDLPPLSVLLFRYEGE